jgi:hypothetical protein
MFETTNQMNLAITHWILRNPRNHPLVFNLHGPQYGPTEVSALGNHHPKYESTSQIQLTHDFRGKNNEKSLF